MAVIAAMERRGGGEGEVNLSTANAELSALTCLKRGCAT